MLIAGRFDFLKILIVFYSGTKQVPYFALFRNQMLAFFVTGHRESRRFWLQDIDDDRCAFCKSARFTRSADRKLFHSSCARIIETYMSLTIDWKVYCFQFLINIDQNGQNRHQEILSGETFWRFCLDHTFRGIPNPETNGFPQKSFVGLLTTVCAVWLDTNTSVKLLHALKYVSLDRCNMSTVLYELVLAL